MRELRFPGVGGGGLELDAEVVAAMRAQLPHVAERTVAALTAEVAQYAGALDGEMGAAIEQAVQMALGTFLRLAAPGNDTAGPGGGDTEGGGSDVGADGGRPLHAALEGAYALGRGEARSGRTMDALLSAYRVGARASWRELSATAVQSGLAAATVAQFAELVFAYIDELSAASVAGHTDELATSGRVRSQYRERLAQALLAGEAPETLLSRAAQADWEPPTTLTAVLLPSARVRDTVPLLDARTLAVALDEPEDTTVLLVPDVSHGRPALLSLLRGRVAVVGPARPWAVAATSVRRATSATALVATGLVVAGGVDALDTEQHLAALVLGADPEALADLRARALTPLSGLRPATAERLAETLRSWLLHQGRREDVAADLVVHAQTVRYRMSQVRELYGEALSDPTTVLELTVALALPPPPEGPPPTGP